MARNKNKKSVFRSTLASGLFDEPGEEENYVVVVDPVSLCSVMFAYLLLAPSTW